MGILDGLLHSSEIMLYSIKNTSSTFPGSDRSNEADVSEYQVQVLFGNYRFALCTRLLQGLLVVVYQRTDVARRVFSHEAQNTIHCYRMRSL